jgi:cell division transport system permease protein
MTVAAKTAYFWRSALQGLRHSPFVHLVAITTIAIALFTAGLARAAVRTLDALVASIGGEVEMTVYLADGTSGEAAASLATAWQGLSGGAARVVSPAEAADRLRGELGDLGDALKDLPDNPLPETIELRIPPSARTPEALQTLASEVKKAPAVTGVDYGEQAVARLSSISAAVKYGGAVAFVIVVVATIIIVAATLQLAIYARRDEIEIQKLVGATDRFVKVPFLLEGIFQGLLGAGLAVAGLWAFGMAAGPRLSQLFAFLLGPGAHLTLWDPMAFLELVCAGCGLGLCGSFIAVGRFLRV